MFNGLSEEATETYKFDITEKWGISDLVRVKGNLVVGLKDYERIYIDVATKIVYDRYENILTGDIELENTEMLLVFDTFIEINNVKLTSTLDDIFVNSISIKTNDDNYRTDYGMIIEKPEDSCDDKEFTIIIPEEQLFGSITVY